MLRPTSVIATDDAPLQRRLHRLLLRRDWTVVVTSTATELLQTVHRRHLDLVLLGPFAEGIWRSVEVAHRLRQWQQTLPTILLTPHSSEALAIAALRAGIRDYFTLPISSADLIASMRRCCTTLLPQALHGAPGETELPHGPLMLGDSAPMRQIKVSLGKVAAADSPVLITGETGTGKELAAALIHQNSARRHAPLISINCAAIPDSLLESELFGYERGAFTGAHSTKAGLLQLAEGGTVFLDEVGDMSPYAQAKILRSLENKEIQRLGGRQSLPVNIRVIAATNQELEQRVTAGTFRQDLYFRLNVARLHLPPLRERCEDILPLLTHYIQDANHRFGRQVERFTADALGHLLRYAWPGNVRELKNLVEASFIELPTPYTTLLDLPERFLRQCQTTAEVTPQHERDRLLHALCTTQWNKSKAAAQLHWSRMTLYRKIAKYHIVSGGQRDDER